MTNLPDKKRAIFLVDDHPLVRDWLTQLINNEPDLSVCGGASTADEALSKIAVVQPALAIIDISLQNSSGLDLIKSLRPAYPDLLLIVLSMHEETIFAERALRAGARGYVIKRETAEQIIAAIRKVLEGGIYLNESHALGLAENLIKQADSTPERIEDRLSGRELEIFRSLGQGRKTSQIAEQLNISLKTVHSYCARIKEKLHLSNSTELLREAVCWFEQQRS